MQAYKVGEFVTETIDFIAYKGVTLGEKSAATAKKVGEDIACGRELTPQQDPENGFIFMTYNILQAALQDDGFTTYMQTTQGQGGAALQQAGCPATEKEASDAMDRCVPCTAPPTGLYRAARRTSYWSECAVGVGPVRPQAQG